MGRFRLGTLAGLAGLLVCPVAARAGTIDSYSFTETGWVEAAQHGTVGSDGFIELQDPTSFQVVIIDKGKGIPEKKPGGLTLFSIDTNGGASTLDYAGALLQPEVWGGAPVTLDITNCNPAGAFQAGVDAVAFNALEDIPAFFSMSFPVVTFDGSVTMNPAPSPGTTTATAEGAMCLLCGVGMLAMMSRCGKGKPGTRLAGVLVTAGMLLAGTAAKADIQTSITFTTPTLIQPGGNVTFDFGVSLLPLAATTGPPAFTDNTTGNTVTSCALDPNSCTEIQIGTTASTLVAGSVFAEVLAVTTATQTVPTFYPFTNVGSFPLTFTYPDPGKYEITVAGAGDQEQFNENECVTQWNGGVAQGAAVCSNIQTVTFAGAFDPQGTPDVFVTVAAAPEPGSRLLSGAGLVGLAWLVWWGRREEKGEERSAKERLVGEPPMGS